MGRVVQELLARRCQVELRPDDRAVLSSGTPGRGSALAIVDGGMIWLERSPWSLTLHYDLSTNGTFLFCVVGSVVGAALAWFALDSAWLATWALVGPLAWVYGVNYAVAAVRIPALLRRLALDGD